MRLLPLLIVLTACQREDTVSPPTAEEHQRLDNAESMLNGLANEEGPKNASAPSGPSN